IVADARDALVMGRAAIHGAALAEHVAIADDELRRLAAGFLVLRRIADGGELENPVVLADGGRAVDDRVRPDDGARTDLHLRADDAEGTYRDIGCKPRIGRDDGTCVDHGALPG